MSGERLELVRSFDELRAGMIVVVKGCGRCATFHRGLLVSFEKATECASSNGVVTTEDTWEVSPPGACGAAYIGSYDVDVHRCVFRVVDDVESSDEYRRSLSADEDLAKVRAHQRQKARAR